VHPGSWINANYGIWIGHPEENRAWELLAAARAAAVAADPEVARLLAGGEWRWDAAADDRAAAVCRALFAAEGSDWFWWYGDDHFSAHSDRFDLLFRRHLMAVYRLLSMEVPAALYEPIKKKSPAGLVREPAAFITPRLSGTVDDYFEWLAAGLYDLSRQSSAMHASESVLRSLFYGFDRESLYFRVDGELPLECQLAADDILTLYLLYQKEYRVVVARSSQSGPLQVKLEGGWQATGAACRWAVGKVCEVQVPIAPLGLAEGDNLFAYLSLSRGGDERGRWPVDAPLALHYAGQGLELDNWLI
jgi:hypothetical protein